MKLKLHLAVLGSVFAAALHRFNQPNALALGNADAAATADAEADTEPKGKAAEKELARIKDDEKLIAQKMSVGLTRDQAIAALRHQRDYDAKKKASKK